jgi:small multidrug resistance pump
MKIAYLWLTLAIVAEVVGTTALKASEEFTRLIPTTIVVVGYGIAIYLLALVVRTMPVGIAYAVWAGLGIVLIALTSAVVYKQTPDLPAIIGIALIIAGVYIINVYSKMITH